MLGSLDMAFLASAFNTGADITVWGHIYKILICSQGDLVVSDVMQFGFLFWFGMADALQLIVYSLQWWLAEKPDGFPWAVEWA